MALHVVISYRDPKIDQQSKVVQDVFGNDLASFNNETVVILA